MRGRDLQILLLRLTEHRRVQHCDAVWPHIGIFVEAVVNHSLQVGRIEGRVDGVAATVNDLVDDRGEVGGLEGALEGAYLVHDAPEREYVDLEVVCGTDIEARRVGAEAGASVRTRQRTVAVRRE